VALVYKHLTKKLCRPQKKHGLRRAKSRAPHIEQVQGSRTGAGMQGSSLALYGYNL